MPKSTVKIWASGCAHVSADKRQGRESLAEAIRQAERDFEWDIGINIGDFSAAFGLPTDAEGAEIIRQFGALATHRREDIYTICGNHDRNAPDEPEANWFRRWIDPLGENTVHSKVDATQFRHLPVGTWERYYFDVGNIRVLMMSDINEKTQLLGRGALGGNPGGVVSRETFDWWVDQVESNHRDKIIITAHHYLLKNTTVATGEWEGMKKMQMVSANQLSWLLRTRHSAGCVIPLLGWRPPRWRCVRKLARRPPRNGRLLAGRSHPYQPRGPVWWQITYRKMLWGHNICERLGIDTMVCKGSRDATFSAVHL